MKKVAESQGLRWKNCQGNMTMLAYLIFFAVATSRVGCHPILLFFTLGNPYSGAISLEKGSMMVDEVSK
jgi:hypothetical protein